VLLKLSADQISRYWEDIKAAIIAAVPPLGTTDQGAVSQFLENLLMGRLQAWLLVEQQGEGERAVFNIKALAVTTVWRDLGTGAKNLLIYALYGYSFVEPALWKDGLGALKKFAEAEGCHQIVAFTKVPRVLQIVKELGGESEMRLVTLEVGI
jgi:hypothetical protein